MTNGKPTAAKSLLDRAIGWGNGAGLYIYNEHGTQIDSVPLDELLAALTASAQLRHFPALVNELTDAAKTMEQVAKDLRSGFNHRHLKARAERYRYLLNKIQGNAT